MSVSRVALRVPIFTLLVGFTSATIIDIPADQPRFLDGSNVGAVQYVCDSLVRVSLDIPPNLYADSVITIELERVTGDMVTLANLKIYQFEQEEEGQPRGGLSSSGLEQVKIPSIEFSIQPSVFRNGADLHFSLPGEAHVEIVIFNITGRRVNSLLDKKMEGGRHTIRWTGELDNDRKAPNGVYFIQLKALSKGISRKVLILR
jgi:hypothetical protein